jgi:hypothetical protein
MLGGEIDKKRLEGGENSGLYGTKKDMLKNNNENKKKDCAC